MRLPNFGDVITLDPRVVVRVETEVARCRWLREDDREQVLTSPLVPLLLLALASTVKVPCWFVGLGNVKVNVPVTGSLVVVTTGLKG